MSKAKKIFSLILAIISVSLCCFVFCGCVDYEYSYYFSVEGGDGTLAMFVYDEILESDNSPVRLMGGRRGIQQFAFLATPSEGYRVKQWTCDGQVVQGNKTIIYVCDRLAPSKWEVYITVEFELIEVN